MKDCIFLYRYNEPVLLILYESDPTAPGALRDRKDTCSLLAVSISVAGQPPTRIWSASKLPSDAYRLIPVHTGGALILCLNTILYIDQVGVDGRKLFCNIV